MVIVTMLRIKAMGVIVIISLGAGPDFVVCSPIEF